MSRANVRWSGAPRPCAETWMLPDGYRLRCTRDGKHPGRHNDPRRGEWRVTSEVSLASEEANDVGAERLQFANLDWQDRWAANPTAPVAYCHYDVGRDSLMTVGPLGTVFLNKRQVELFLARTRTWLSAIEKYMEGYQ